MPRCEGYTQEGKRCRRRGRKNGLHHLCPQHWHDFDAEYPDDEGMHWTTMAQIQEAAEEYRQYAWMEYKQTKGG